MHCFLTVLALILLYGDHCFSVCQPLRKIPMIQSWSVCFISHESHNSLILANVKKHYSSEKCLSDICILHWSNYALSANRHLYAVVKKECGHKRVHRQHHDASTVAAAIGEKGDKATLISEEIKSLALAVLELCVSESISK